MLLNFIPGLSRYPVLMILVEIMLLCFFGGIIWNGVWKLFSGEK